MKPKVTAQQIVDAAKALSESCYDNYGTLGADEGHEEAHYSDKAKEKLDALLLAWETQNKA